MNGKIRDRFDLTLECIRLHYAGLDSPLTKALVVETDRLPDWRRFGADAIGLHVEEVTPDVTRFRLDDHSCRFLLQRGPAEDVTALGWQVTTHEAFDEILSRVTARGLPVREGTPDECALRGVERLWRSPGPRAWPPRSSPHRSWLPNRCG